MVSPEEKKKAVLALNAGGNVNEIAKRLKVTPSSVYAWRKSSKANGADHSHRDTIVYLEHAQRDIIRRIREGRAKEISGAELLALLALRTLKP